MDKISAVFLDRDGVINLKLEGDYVKKWEEFKFLPGVIEAIRLINKKGIPAYIITNQSGIGRGKMTLNDLEAVHKKMLEELKSKGAKIDGIYVCPHSPEDDCDCRKPKPGLLFQAKQAHPEIEFEDSWFIGDSDIDEKAGKAAGCRTYLIRKNENLKEVLERLLGK